MKSTLVYQSSIYLQNYNALQKQRSLLWRADDHQRMTWVWKCNEDSRLQTQPNKEGHSFFPRAADYDSALEFFPARQDFEINGLLSICGL
jgi:hypothetical protein